MRILLHLQKFFLLLLQILVLSSCVENIDIDLPKNRKVVVNCILTSEPVQQLSLTYSNELGKAGYNEVLDANITLFDSDHEVRKFQKSSYGEWKMGFTPTKGKLYTLRVEISNLPTITAHTIFPNALPIKRVKKNDTNGKRAFEIDSTGIFWTCAFEKAQDTIMRPVVISPKFNLISSIGTDYPVTDHFNMLNFNSKTTGKYLAYIRMLPVNQNTSFSINDLYNCVVVFQAVSDEYDQYLKSSLAKMLVYKSFNDPSQWLDESVIYSNIINGIGIFGAYNETKFNCNLGMPD